MGVEVAGEGFGSTAEVSDAHGTCIGVTAYFPEGLYRDRTRKIRVRSRGDLILPA